MDRIVDTAVWQAVPAGLNSLCRYLLVGRQSNKVEGCLLRRLCRLWVYSFSHVDWCLTLGKAFNLFMSFPLWRMGCNTSFLLNFQDGKECEGVTGNVQSLSKLLVTSLVPASSDSSRNPRHMCKSLPSVMCVFYSKWIPICSLMQALIMQVFSHKIDLRY